MNTNSIKSGKLARALSASKRVHSSQLVVTPLSSGIGACQPVLGFSRLALVANA